MEQRSCPCFSWTLSPEGFSTTSQPLPAERIEMEKGSVIITKERGTRNDVLLRVKLSKQACNIAISLSEIALHQYEVLQFSDTFTAFSPGSSPLKVYECQNFITQRQEITIISNHKGCPPFPMWVPFPGKSQQGHIRAS